MGDPTFLFTEADMSRIVSLPLYGDGGYGLPADSVATVAFSAGTYLKNGSTTMSFNVQFVVFLGQVNRHKMECMLTAMGK
jgi:hypothetical protein